MPSFTRGPLATVILVAAACVMPALAAPTTTIRGEVVELACALGTGADGQGANGTGEAHAACAMQCARDGRAMAILTADEIYLIEGDYTANKNAKLLDFVAKQVEGKGSISERDGKKVITIAAMMVLKADK